MAKLVAPFDITGNFPIDRRFVFNTIAEMKEFDIAHLPDAYFSVCVESNKMYIYNKDNDIDELTGRWREFISNKILTEGKGISISEDNEISVKVDDETIKINDDNQLEIPAASKDTPGLTKKAYFDEDDEMIHIF